VEVGGGTKVNVGGMAVSVGTLIVFVGGIGVGTAVVGMHATMKAVERRMINNRWDLDDVLNMEDFLSGGLNW
jgi:hypothetical protein